MNKILIFLSTLVHSCPQLSTVVHSCPQLSTVVHSCPQLSTVVHSCSRIVQFNQDWNYQKYYNLTYGNSFSLKFINGYFYFSANYYFYKTDINFNLNASYNNPNAYYRSIYYDSSSGLFYVCTGNYPLSVFDTNSNFQRFMTLAL
jgi:hypothetical protein